MASMASASSSPRRKSSLAAQERMRSMLADQEAGEAEAPTRRSPLRKVNGANAKVKAEDDGDFDIQQSSDESSEHAEPFIPANSRKEGKKRKAAAPAEQNEVRARNKTSPAQLKPLWESFSSSTGTVDSTPCRLPDRTHSMSYHRPLLLDPKQGSSRREALLQWFDRVSEMRAMPWRKKWIDPIDYDEQSSATLRSDLERRAYEVWISEIMLQQTRVAVVIDYWNRWMARWPTIHDLAAAEPDEVLSAWRGLGYYSRATRIHEAAKQVVADKEMQGLLPQMADQLQAKVPGVGRYTGGAISAIVFGHSAPMVDGNVLRVLSRQLGLLANVKTDKVILDTLWAAADALAKAVAEDQKETRKGVGALEPMRSDAPGRWGQALMELGSTICTPKPDCGACPISNSCRAFAEGQQSAVKSKVDNGAAAALPDLEDLCTLCESMAELAIFEQPEEEEVEHKPPPSKKGRQSTLSAFAFTAKSNGKGAADKMGQEVAASSSQALEVAINHAKRFPVKVVKKAVREEETLVCAIRWPSGEYLLHRRPDKGLLAGMWELPSMTLAPDNGLTERSREEIALEFAREVAGDELPGPLTHVGELGNIPWLFSHLRLTMHVHHFRIGKIHGREAKPPPTQQSSSPRQRWATPDQVEAESMGTGMRKCWSLVKEAR